MQLVMRSYALFFVVSTLFAGAWPLGAAPTGQGQGDLAQIHTLVYQKGFSRKGLSRALALCDALLGQSPSAEAFLYKAMALYRLRRFQDSYRTAKAGLRWLKRHKPQKATDKSDVKHYIQKELVKLQNQARGRLRQGRLRRKLQQRQEARSAQGLEEGKKVSPGGPSVDDSPKRSDQGK
jgi:hypothetical protein